MSYDLKIKNGDLFLVNGQPQTVVDSEKLIQSILKVCLTEAGALPFHPWYGSFLSRTLIGSPQHSSILVQIAKSQLNAALENIKNLQDAQTRSFQRVSADEQISAIMGISVVQNQIDPRLFDVRISVLSKGLKPITTAFSVDTI